MEDKEQLIREIDKRIDALSEHRGMWFRAGGMGGKMSLQANTEIAELEKEKECLMNSDDLSIYYKEKKIRELQKLKKEALFLKKLKYSLEISKQQKELEIVKKNGAIKK